MAEPDASFGRLKTGNVQENIGDRASTEQVRVRARRVTAGCASSLSALQSIFRDYQAMLLGVGCDVAAFQGFEEEIRALPYKYTHDPAYLSRLNDSKGNETDTNGNSFDIQNTPTPWGDLIIFRVEKEEDRDNETIKTDFGAFVDEYVVDKFVRADHADHADYPPILLTKEEKEKRKQEDIQQHCVELELKVGDIAGCIAVRKLTLSNEGSANNDACSTNIVGEVKRLFVVPNARRRGIGRKLAMLIKDIASKQLGYKALYLDTLERLPAAIKLYESLGFARCEAYCYNPEHDAVYMSYRTLL